VTKPRLLDLFCGAGGAAMGYHRAGFEVTGVDVKPQPRYPFAFVQADAMTYPLDGFDAIHASPPCQAYSSATLKPDSHPDLYGATRDRLLGSGVEWVIENVIGAPYRHGIVLCGRMFGMQVQRHRNFETSWLVMQPPHSHEGFNERPITVTGHGGNGWQVYKHSRKAPRSMWGELMGMPWADYKEVAQAIPPAYTEWIGRELLQLLKVGAP
jgi:DNA (cytosine-5)-methyltransferase 1